MDSYVTSASALTSFNTSELVTSPSSTDVMGLLTNQTLDSNHAMRDVDKQRIIIIAVIMAFTLIGNMTLILVLLCKRSRRIKRVNILLLNLAFGDLAVALFVNSTEILFLAFGDWALGPVMCKISVYVQMICLSSATNLLTAMSIDRYQVIVKPMQSLARRPRIWLKIAIAWTLSLLFPLPQLFIFVQYKDGLKYDGTPKRICGSRGYTAPWQRKVNFTFTTSYILIVPMVIMLYCYVEIIRVVWIRASYESRRRPSCLTQPGAPLAAPPSTTCPMLPPQPDTDSKQENSDVGCGCDGLAQGRSRGGGGGGGSAGRGVANSVRWARSVKDKNDNSRDKSKKGKRPDLGEGDLNPGSPRMSVRRSLVTASKRRALVMTLTVVVSFLVCHTPYFFVNLVRIYSDYQVKMERFKIMSEFMVLVHSTLNPVLFGVFTLRQYHLKSIVAFLTCSERPSPRSSHRARQLSDERNKLLSSVRSRLSHHNSGNADTTSSSSTTAAPARGSNNINNLHPHQKSRHHKQTSSSSSSSTAVATTSPTNTTSATMASSPHSSPSSSRLRTSTISPASILRQLRCRRLPRLHRKSNKNGRGQESLLFTNTDAIHLTRHLPARCEETENTDIEPATPPTPPHLEAPILFANPLTVKTSSCPPTGQPTSTTVRLSQDGCDVTVRSQGLSDDDVSRGVKASPWVPQDDEFMLGGLTRV